MKTHLLQFLARFMSFVQAGFGVGLVDGLLPWDGFPGVVARPFVPRVTMPVCLLSDARRDLTQMQELLRAKLRAAAKHHLAKKP